MKKLHAIIVFVIVSLLIANAAAIMYFVLHKPATFRIVPNTFGVELYVEPVNATTIVTSIDFPSLMQSDPNNTSTSSPLRYLFASTEPRNYALRWFSPDLPSGMSLIAKWNLAGEVYYNWQQNATQNVDLVLPNSGQPGMRLFFVLTPNAASIGNYTFSINIEAGQ